MYLDKVIYIYTVSVFRVELGLFFVSDEYARSSHPSCINTDIDAISLQNCIGASLLEMGCLRQVKKSLISFFLLKTQLDYFVRYRRFCL